MHGRLYQLMVRSARPVYEKFGNLLWRRNSSSVHQRWIYSQQITLSVKGFSSVKDDNVAFEPNKSMGIKCENILQYLKVEWLKINKLEPLKSDVAERISRILLHHNAPEALIGRLILENPLILQKPVKQFEECTGTLIEYGFNGGQLVNILPAFLRNTPSKKSLTVVLNTIRSFGFTDEEIPKMFSKYPQLFLLEESELTNRYNNLQMILPMTQLKTMIYNCPNMLLHSIASTMEKYDYIVHEMGLNDKDISHSKVFHHSIEHIRVRHTLLLRAGLYEKPKPDGTTKNIINPRLRRIVDTTDLEFAHKIADVALEDYWCFRNVLSVELDHLTNDDVDSDDEYLSSYKRK
ncbi:transcription termination factor 4, mitochondrial-like [Tubulanus polymorphus]|uniref:transcription termination factor 4, mitochondrial-like n=1 Tax=Tubulanus polymorphus TaxID=672921 RepID=UPI003DA22516